jgi:hypothetical protein
MLEKLLPAAILTFILNPIAVIDFPDLTQIPSTSFWDKILTKKVMLIQHLLLPTKY